MKKENRPSTRTQPGIVDLHEIVGVSRDELDSMLHTAKDIWHKPKISIKEANQQHERLHRTKVNAPRTTKIRLVLTSMLLGTATSQALLDVFSEYGILKPNQYLALGGLALLNAIDAQSKSIAKWTNSHNRSLQKMMTANGELAMNRFMLGEDQHIVSTFLVDLKKALSPLSEPGTRAKSDPVKNAKAFEAAFTELLDSVRDLAECDRPDAAEGLDFVTSVFSKALRSLREELENVNSEIAQSKEKQSNGEKLGFNGHKKVLELERFAKFGEELLPVLLRSYGQACALRNFYEKTPEDIARPVGMLIAIERG